MALLIMLGPALSLRCPWIRCLRSSPFTPLSLPPLHSLQLSSLEFKLHFQAGYGVCGQSVFESAMQRSMQQTHVEVSVDAGTVL